MKTIVVGCGKIGNKIVATLAGEGDDVIAIDNNPDVLEQLANVYDVMTLCGNGADCDALHEAGVENCDLFVALTESDELNMLSCFLARRMGAKHTIARIRNPEYNDQSLGFMRHHLDISVALNPEQLAAKEIFNVLKFPYAVKIESFSARHFEMVEIRLPQDSILDGLTVREMREKYDAGYLISAVQRGEDAFIPSGNFVLHSGDKIGITASQPEVQKLMKMLGLAKKQAKNVMILGGGRTTYYLARMLTNGGVNVKIFEKELKECEALSDMLPGATVLHDDGTSVDMLLEEGLAAMDAFVALTGSDEENILSSISVFLQNVPKVIAKLHNEELRTLASKIGLDSTVSPTEITANIVLRYARAIKNTTGSKVETLYKLMDGKAEALEFIVGEENKLTGVPLKDLKWKQNVLIAGIVRGRKTIIPSGNDVIQTGDHVVVLSTDKGLNDLSDTVE